MWTATETAQPCRAVLQGLNKEPWCRGKSQSLCRGLHANHGLHDSRMSLKTDNVLRGAWEQNPQRACLKLLHHSSHHPPKARRQHQEGITMYICCSYILHRSLYWPLPDKGFGARQTFDLAADTDWWMMLALTANKKDKWWCCDLL